MICVSRSGRRGRQRNTAVVAASRSEGASRAGVSARSDSLGRYVGAMGDVKRRIVTPQEIGDYYDLDPEEAKALAHRVDEWNRRPDPFDSNDFERRP
jgi:hypothetical protein